MSDKNKKKQIAKITVFITSIFIIFLSVTYAFINLTLFGNKRQVITVGNLQLRLEEENEITLENAFPMYDEVGMIQPSFNFQLINETDTDIKYILKLEDITEEDANRLENSIVRYGFVKEDNEPIIGSLSDIEKENYKLEEATISKNTTIDFSLRLWIDHEVTDDKEISGKSLKYRIGVDAEQGQKYVVSFDTKDPSITVEEGKTYENLPTPTKTGYKFFGWYTEEEGEGEKIEKDTKFEANKNQTLYAYFEKLPNAPELGSNLVPVIYNEKSKNWQVADASNPNEEWYNYDKQEWANAVTLDHTKVLDLSGENNHGKISGSILKNNEVTLDGIDDYIDCGLAGYEFGTTFSTVVRFKIESFPTTTYKYGIIIGNADAAGMILGVTDEKKIYYEIHDGTSYQYKAIDQPLTEKKWYEVALTFDGNKITFYLDGKETDSISLSKTSSMKISKMPFYLGANPNNGSTGIITEELANITYSKAQIYKRTLTKEDVDTIYKNGELENKESILVDYDFKMDKTMKSGTLLPMDMISTMFVWIPRYSYTIKSEDGENYFGKQEEGRETIPSSDLPGAIDVHFVAKDTVETGSAQYTNEVKRKDTWKTPEGFTFDNKQVSGLWVGKFELSHNSLSETVSESNHNNLNCTGTLENCTSADGLKILPNKISLRWNNVSNFFYAIKSMQRNGNPFGFETDQNKVDIHMIKNNEWGVVSYLSQSKYGKYGNSDYDDAEKQVKINNCDQYKTGIGANNQDASGDSSVCTNLENQYNGQYGKSASTTGNITGIYDMAGGSYEYVMGVLADENDVPRSGSSNSSNSGFNGALSSETYSGIPFPNAKYYDLYTKDLSTSCTTNRKCYGHALLETAGWYNDYASFVSSSNPWLIRGGIHYSNIRTGVFSYTYTSGSSYEHYSSRVIILSF